MTFARHEKFVNYTFPQENSGKPKKDVSHTFPGDQKLQNKKAKTAKDEVDIARGDEQLVAKRIVHWDDSEGDSALEYLESIAQSVVVPARLFLDLSVESSRSDAFGQLPVKGSNYVAAAMELSMSDSAMSSPMSTSSY